MAVPKIIVSENETKVRTTENTIKVSVDENVFKLSFREFDWAQFTSMQSQLDLLQTQINTKTHNSLLSIQGGTTDEYYHLTLAQLNSLSTFLTDAPSDGKQYARENATWTEIVSGISDAPIDGKTYGRKDGAWSEVTSGPGGDSYWQKTLSVVNLVTSSDKVSIGGTTADNGKLQVISSSAGNVTDVLALQNSSTSTNTGVRLLMGATSNITAEQNGTIAFVGTRQSDGSMDFDIKTAPGGSAAITSRFYIDGSTGNFGFSTSSPTHTLTLPSTSTGIALYNTADQTTAYERGQIYWNSNVFTIGAFRGTGSQRATHLTTTTGQLFKLNTSGPWYEFQVSSSGTTGFIGSTLTSGAASGTVYLMNINATLNQSATAGYTGLLLTVTENSVGSGAKNLILAQVGGVDKFSISNTGYGYISDSFGVGSVPGGYFKLDVTGPTILRKEGDALYLTQSNAAGYTGMRIYNDQGSGTRSLEIDYSGSTYASPLLTNGPTGESASITTTGAYPLCLGTNNTARVTLSSTGLVGFGTAAPTHTITLPSTSTGISIYNTADQTTNYERLNIGFASNAIEIGSFMAGTGTGRELRIGASIVSGSTTVTGGTYIRMHATGGPAIILQARNSPTLLVNSSAVQAVFTNSCASGITNGLEIYGIMSQSSTAGYNGLKINVTESTVGSGAKNLILAQVGGSDKFKVSNTGAISLSSGVAISSFLDEDDFASNSDTALPTQQSVKAYVDTFKPITYFASTMTVNYGTLIAGTVTDLQALGGTDVNIQEVSGSNALQVEFNFGSVTRLTSFSFFGYYAGGAGHEIAAEIYNWGTTSWDSLGMFSTNSVKQWYSFPIFNSSAYISSGNVKTRFRHIQTGVVTHNLYLDYLNINYGGSTGASSIGASSIYYVPTGDISSTDVQTAISELDNEKASLSFSTIAVSGQSDVVADSKSDTLTLVAGTNITITTNASSDSVTINASGGSGYSEVQEEGTTLTARSKLNFIGSGITAADDAGNSRTNVSLDATLNALSSYNTNGILTQTAADTFTGRTITGTTNEITVSNGDGVSGNPTLSLGTNAKTGSLTFVIDGGGSAITTGQKGFIEVPFSCTISAVTMLADTSGSIVVDIWKDTYANFPPTVADTITASAKPTISTAQKSQDTTLTGWTTSVSAGDILAFNVDSASTVKRVTLSLKVIK